MIDILNEFKKNLIKLFKNMETIKKFRLSRRRLLIFVLCFCLLFLIYQLMSLKKLNIQMSEQLTHTSEQKFVVKHTFNGNQRSKEWNQMEINPIIETKSEEIIVNKSKTFRILGVLPQNAEHYRKTSDTFRCLSGEEIPYQYLNDDYCDCFDGSDEPSTNACPLNKFYCRINSGKSGDYISSAKVNDGICDCCDGSDEFRAIASPLKLTKSQIETIKSSRRLVPTPPCPYTCPNF